MKMKMFVIETVETLQREARYWVEGADEEDAKRRFRDGDYVQEELDPAAVAACEIKTVTKQG